MSAPAIARRLMIIVGGDAMIGRSPAFAEIVRLARESGLAGASVFRGIEGFGSSGRVHTSRILDLSENLPAMIVIIDAAEKIHGFLPRLQELGVRGVVALDDVELVHPGSEPAVARS